MDRKTQTAQIRRMFDYLDRRTTELAADVYRQPVADYTCRQVLARERERLFDRLPSVACLSCEVTSPGSYLAVDIAGVPILVVRGDDGAARGFLNVCRHRGAPVLSGRGECKKAMHCPYHGWSYDREGKLLAVSTRHGFGSIDRDQHGLVRVPLVERAGLIWVVPRPAEPQDDDRGVEHHLEACVGELFDELASYRADTYHHYQTRFLGVAMNWKLVIDGFLESYHLTHLHPNTVAPMFFGDVSTFAAFGPSLRFVVPRRTLTELHDRPESEWDLYEHSFINYLLFPGTLFAMQRDHLEVWQVFPDGDQPGRSTMRVSLYTPEPALTDKARGHWDANLDLLFRTVEEEDFPLGERMQQGFSSGAQEHITFGRNEPSLAHFHRSLADALADEATAGGTTAERPALATAK